MLALHAGVDWDWEMPALFVWLFGAGGVVLASRAGRGWASSAATPRIVAALAVLVLAITPALFALLAGPAGPRRATAFARARLPDGDRRGADRHRALRHAAGAVAGPRLLRRAARRSTRSRGAAMDAARARDPDNWQFAYGQAIVYGVVGPRPAARTRAEALRLNPLDPLARALRRDLAAAKTAARRREVARRAADSVRSD